MRRHFLFFGFMAMVGGRLCAQAVSVGVLGGVPFTNPTGPGDESRPYLIGPSVEVRLPAGFAIEADALYRRIGGNSAYLLQEGIVSTSFSERERANSWQFPVLGKYYFGSRTSSWRPFLGTGYSFRIADESVNSVTTTTSATGTQTMADHFHAGSGLGIGATVAAGVRFQKGRIAVLPQFRYTRWSDNANNLNPRNEAAFLLGITF